MKKIILTLICIISFITAHAQSFYSKRIVVDKFDNVITALPLKSYIAIDVNNNTISIQEQNNNPAVFTILGVDTDSTIGDIDHPTQLADNVYGHQVGLIIVHNSYIPSIKDLFNKLENNQITEDEAYSKIASYTVLFVCRTIISRYTNEEIDELVWIETANAESRIIYSH